MTELAEIPPNVLRARDKIKSLIKRGELEQGGKVPSVRLLSEQIGFNRDAIWRALKLLEQDEWLEALQNGRYVLRDGVRKQHIHDLKVGFLVPGMDHVVFLGFQHLYWAMERLLRKHQTELDLLLISHFDPIGIEEIQNADVVLVIGEMAHRAHTLLENNVPVVNIYTAYEPDYPIIVNPDSFADGERAAKIAVQNGCQQARVISFHRGNYWIHTELRYQGFEKGWLESGRRPESLKRMQVPETLNRLRDMETLRDALQAEAEADFYFAIDENVGYGTLNVFELLDVAVPEQVKVIGYDAEFSGQHTVPGLTTFAQPMEVLAERAYEMLLKVISGEPMEKIVEKHPAEIIERGSCPIPKP